jgi:hypothetical protein
MPFFLTQSTMVWLLPAVALPILFHLFFRLRRSVHEFPSLMFFLRIDPRLSAKRKVHEWLILVLRCLFILLLILALARPLLGIKGAGGSVARLVLIDNSGSMAATTPGGVSKLTLAEQATQKLIASGKKDDVTAVQLMVPDPTSTIPHGFDAARATLRGSVDKLPPSDGGASVPKAIRLALSTLNTAITAQRELHIITDLQRKNWSRGDLSGEVIAPNVRIIVHRLETAPLTTGSVSIEPMELISRAVPAGRIIPVRVALQNHGPATAHVRLNTTDDSGKNVSHTAEVGPNASVLVTVTFSFGNPGFHWAQIWAEGDVAPTANSADLGFWCTDAQKVLFVGTKTDFAALPYAVSPGGNSDLSGIEADFVSADQMAASLASKPLAVALTWDNWPTDSATSQAVQDYVRHGGTLLLSPAPDAGATAPHPLPDWITASPEALQTPKDPEPVTLLQDGDAIWHDLRNAEGRPTLGLLRTFQYRPLKLITDWKSLATSAQGAPLLAQRNWDQGRIFASGLAFSPKWSSLPLKAAFVVLVQNVIFGGQSGSTPVRLMKAAEEYQFDFTGEQASIKSLAGSALQWQGSARDFPGFPRTGVYEIKQQDRANWVATAGNADEADPDFLPLGPVPLLHDLPHDTLPLTHENDLAETEIAQNTGLPLYRWLLLVALTVTLAETWLANERSSDLGKRLFHSLLPSFIARKPAAAKTGALKK